MKRYRVTALALSPVVIPNEGFISGSTFRGALAYQYLRTRGITDPNGDELFQRAFTRERLRVSPFTRAGLSCPSPPYLASGTLVSETAVRPAPTESWICSGPNSPAGAAPTTASCVDKILKAYGAFTLPTRKRHRPPPWKPMWVLTG